MSERIDVDAVLAERDRILVELDVSAAKQFIRDHGGIVTRIPVDWLKVLHLARLEVVTMSEGLRRASRLYLAMHGAMSLAMLPSGSVYAAMALAILFPVDLFRQTMEGVAHGR